MPERSILISSEGSKRILLSIKLIRSSRSLLAVLGLLLVVLATFSGCNIARPPVSSAHSDPLVLRGQQVFVEKGCFQSCHGAGALAASEGRISLPNQPGPVPPDLTISPPRSDDWLRAYFTSPQALLPYSPMAPYNDLSNADMKALIAYLQSIKAVPPPSKVPVVDPQLIPAVPKDAASYRAGRNAYQTYCQGCHGQGGNGKGPVGQLLLPEPRDFTDAAWWSKQSEVYLFSVVSYGKLKTAMPPFNDILGLEQRSQVLNYIGYFSDPVMKQRMELPPRANLAGD